MVFFDSCCEKLLEMDVGSLRASSSLWCWWWTLNEMVCCSLTMICQIWAPWLWEWFWGRIRASGPAWARRPGWSRHLRRAQPQPAPPAARDQRSGETENKFATLKQCQRSGWFSWEYRLETLILIPAHRNSTLALNIIWKIMLMQECALHGVAASSAFYRERGVNILYRNHWILFNESWILSLLQGLRRLLCLMTSESYRI